MYTNIAKVFLLFVFVQSGQCCGDHYWREYQGIIPDDAIPAGTNSKGLSYLGQVYIHNHGLMMGTIIPGKREVKVPCYGVKKSEVMIKILCAKDINKYYWVTRNISNYKHAFTMGECPIVGGYDQIAAGNCNILEGTLHIGRTRHHGDVIVGNIAEYETTTPWFYYPLNDKEIRVEEFEVLVYNSIEPRFEK